MKRNKEKNKLRSVYVEEVDEDQNAQTKKTLMKLAAESLSFTDVLVLTYNRDENIRCKALSRLCPCRVGDEYD